MKITVYTFTTDTDDGLQTQLFTSEPERDAAAFEWLAERDDGRTAEQIVEHFDGDLEMAGQEISNGLDCMNWGEQEIEIPDVTLPLAETERPKLRVAIEVSGGVVQEVYSDTTDQVEVFLLDEDNEHPDWNEFALEPMAPTKMTAIATVAKAEG